HSEKCQDGEKPRREIAIGGERGEAQERTFGSARRMSAKALAPNSGWNFRKGHHCGQRQSRLFESFDCCLAQPTHSDIRAMREMLPPWLARGRSARVAYIRNLCFPFAHDIPWGHTAGVF